MSDKAWMMIAKLILMSNSCSLRPADLLSVVFCSSEWQMVTTSSKWVEPCVLALTHVFMQKRRCASECERMNVFQLCCYCLTKNRHNRWKQLCIYRLNTVAHEDIFGAIIRKISQDTRQKDVDNACVLSFRIIWVSLFAMNASSVQSNSYIDAQ